MWISELILFTLAKHLYRSSMCHSPEMKEALVDRDHYDAYRSTRLGHVMDGAKQCGIDIKGQTVLDFGCEDGALTSQYLAEGASRVVGVDQDPAAIERARQLRASDRLEFLVNRNNGIPLDASAVDVIISHDVFEHVSDPASALDECYRVLRPGGRMLIGTWGWYHPFAPHLFATLPVPWAHCVFSEKTILAASRRVYNAAWYSPTMHDLDERGAKIQDKYASNEISLEYLNKLLIRDFEALFNASRFDYDMFPQPFSSRYARWTKIGLNVPFVREFITAYVWVRLGKPL